MRNVTPGQAACGKTDNVHRNPVLHLGPAGIGCYEHDVDACGESRGGLGIQVTSEAWVSSGSIGVTSSDRTQILKRLGPADGVGRASARSDGRLGTRPGR
jgi:hypothetical protein